MVDVPRTERFTRAALGASCGFLAAMALVVANIPVLPGSNAGAAACVIALLGGLVAALVPARWIAAVTAGVAVVVFFIAFTPATAGRVHLWIRHDSLPANPPDAVVALSTTITVDGLVDATGTTRLLSALETLRRTNARLLITTRPSQTTPASLAGALQDYQRLIGLAGDSTRWRSVGPVATTHDEALATARLLAPANAHTIVVVTSPIHTRRACATFETVGFSVICRPADERRYALNLFSGVRTRLAATAEWLYEKAATVEYRARGWIR